MNRWAKRLRDIWVKPGIVAVVLSVLIGASCFLWATVDLGGSCGYSADSGLPYFPVWPAFLSLVVWGPIFTGASAIVGNRTWSAISRYMIVSALLAAAGFSVGYAAYFGGNHCYG